MDPVTPVGDLVRAAQVGDHRAFADLLGRSDEKMRRLAHRLLGSRAAMDDALQDAYVKAYRKIGAYNGESAFSTWLYTIVYRTCLDHLRSRRRRDEVDLHPAHVETAATGGIDPAQHAADVDELGQALAVLPPDQVAVVLLVDGDGLSYAEAAAVLDVREGTVASRLNRAHSALRALLDPEGGDI